MLNRGRALLLVALGILSIAAVGVSHLALTDIWHGEGDLATEWNALRACFAMMAGFQILATWVIYREHVRPNAHRERRG